MVFTDLSRKRPNCKNRIELAFVERVISFAFEYPVYSQQKTFNELKRGGVFCPCGVRCVWLRHDLETFKKRLLKALETKAAQEGLVLTEAQVVAMEKAKEEKKAQGEIETHHLGYLGTQRHLLRRNHKKSGQDLPADLH